MVVAELISKIFGGNTSQNIDFFVMHRVKDRWQVLAKGKADPRKAHFSYQGHTYHMDMASVREDETGHKYLQYELGFFEPLVEGVPNEPELAPQSSTDSYLALDRGIVKGVLSSLQGGNTLSGLLILMMILTGLGGYFAGNSLPFCTFNNSCSHGGGNIVLQPYSYTSIVGGAPEILQGTSTLGNVAFVNTVYDPTTVVSPSAYTVYQYVNGGTGGNGTGGTQTETVTGYIVQTETTTVYIQGGNGTATTQVIALTVTTTQGSNGTVVVVTQMVTTTVYTTFTPAPVTVACVAGSPPPCP